MSSGQIHVGGTPARARARGRAPRRVLRSRRGLTLVEVLISVVLIALLLTAALAFYWDTIMTRELASARAERTNIARQFLQRIETELRGAVGFDQVGFPVEQRLTGNRRTLTFLTTALPAKHQYDLFRESEELPPGQHDLTLLTYQLWFDLQDQDDSGQPRVDGIIRTEKKTLNQFVVEEDDPLDLRTELWAAELRYLEFRYFDGVEWSTVWDVSEGNALPHLIQVTCGFRAPAAPELEDQDLEEFPLDEFPYGDNREHEDRYSIVVRIPAADQFFGARVQRVGKQVAESFGVGGIE